MNQIRAKMMLFHDPDKVSALIYLFIYLFKSLFTVAIQK